MRNPADSPMVRHGNRQVQPPPPPEQAPQQPFHSQAPLHQEQRYERLPDHARDQFEQHQAERELRLRAIERRRSATMKRYIFEGMAIFTLLAIFGGSVGMLVGAIYGAGVGFFAWQRGGGNSFSWVGGVAYILWWLFTPWGNLPWGLILCIGLCVLIGMAHTLQKFDGSEC